MPFWLSPDLPELIRSLNHHKFSLRTGTPIHNWGFLWTATWAYQCRWRRRQLIDCLQSIYSPDYLHSDIERSRWIQIRQGETWFAGWYRSVVTVDDVTCGEGWWVGADNSVSRYEAGWRVGVSLPHDCDLTSWCRIVWGCRSWWDSDIS